ncbi:hypothetical protein NEOLEDRAFT_1140488 [Neolentinus lepideus HHB14362 ss-1]|uniref:C2H2-type domain-containing protein n=1 Tax=Neolentinus lepideus HHB14362 ss-1 TaxID=1314782 RepID=A0A165P815_9AGAM|nr:hypothetical protein NEOLEDRAFT_1140488 [Neolentinus lepideus HHB14362 ss-1]
MSWAPSAYPPPRRSRSRSPYRGAAYPPRPPSETDPYRADWETYDYGRDRVWADYERDRAAYDYGGRARSRTPPADETGRKRRRSLSPYDRGRFEPRPRYGDDYDAHSRAYDYSSPHRGQYPPPPPHGGYGRRAPPDPHTFDYPASLKQYAEWFRYFYPQEAIDEDNADKAAEQAAGDGSKPRNGIKTRWEKYKKDFASAQLQRMFDHHRKSPWFAEKYDPSPDLVNLRKRVRKDGWRGRLNLFLNDLEVGKFDPELKESDPAPAVKENASAPAAENGTAPDVGDTSGMAPTVEEVKVEEDAQLEAEDDAGDNDPSRADANGKQSSDARKSNRGEEISVPPEGNQVMIRTIPPDIGRVKLEEACGKVPGFVYLALGDPLQKRNYYRAGWLRFREDADMTSVMSELSDKKIEGFKLHVTHNVKPFVNRVRYAPEVSNKPDRLEKDLANAKVLAAKLEEEFLELRTWQPPKPEAKTSDDTENAKVNGEDHDTTMAEVNGNPEQEDEPEPTEKGTEAVERRVEKVVADLVSQGLVDASDEKALNAKRTVIALDLYLAYLRAAFNTCYYCAVVTDHVEELHRKCIKHVRKPMSKSLLEEIKAAEAEKVKKEETVEETEEDKEKDKEPMNRDKPAENRDWKRNDERWLEWLDSKVALLINRDSVDPRDYGGKSYEEELSRATESHIKQEDEGKFRCKTCQKLFKATSFIEKHILNKHPELVKHLEEIPYFNNFALDPHRIQPFTHPPPSVGNSQGPPPQAYGLQAPVVPYPMPADYTRTAPYYDRYYPPPYAGAPYWDQYAYPYPPPPGYPPRRDDGTVARRLSDRISGYAPGYEHPTEMPVIPVGAGLPAKPAPMLEPGPGGRRGGRANNGGIPPPPPPDAKEDPRAAAGRKVSYHDMDLVAEGDVELTY